MQKVYWQMKKSPVHTWPRIMRLRVLGCSLSTTPIAFDDWTNILSPEYTMKFQSLLVLGLTIELRFCCRCQPFTSVFTSSDTLGWNNPRQHQGTDERELKFSQVSEIVVLCSVERLHHHFRSMCSSVNWELRRRRMSEVEYKGASEGC